MQIRTAEVAMSTQVKSKVLLVGCYENEQEATLIATLGIECGAQALRQGQILEFNGEAGQTYLYFPDGKIGAQLVIVFGMGQRNGGSEGMRKSYAAALRYAKTLKAESVAVAGGPLQMVYAETLALAAGLIYYVPKHYKTKQGGHRGDVRLRELVMLADKDKPIFPDDRQAKLDSGKRIAKAVNLARDLTNDPANKLTPKKFVEEALKVAASSGGTVKAKVLNRKKLEKLGAGALLAVSRGSAQEPYLVELTYTPESGATKEVLGFVGKTVTFDSGGLDLKTADGMRTMKRDMAGGAAVLAAIGAIAALKLPISVKAVMAATENMTGGAAYKPGDVIKTLSGLTVEVDKTDAEGRITLADAIEYAKRRGVTRIVDLATLTGSIREFGGDVMAGAFGNNDQFTKTVLAAASWAGEEVGELPMCAQLRSANHTDIADLKNSGGQPGSVTAAWFIREFAGKIPWVHLDIAGVSYRTRESGLDCKYATGFGVRTLIELARKYSQAV